MRFLLLFGIITTLTTCRQGDYNFKVRKNLKHKKVISLKGFVAKPSMLRLTKNYVVSHDIYSQSTLFTLLSRDSLDQITQFGIIGRGPNEISRTGFYCVDAEHDLLFLSDAGRGQIVVYDLNEPHKKKEILNMPKDMGMLMSFARVREKQFVTQNFSNPEKYSYINFNTSTGSTLYFGEPYYAEEEIVLSDYFNQYYNYFNVNPSKGLFIRAFGKYDLIQLLNESGKVVNEFKGENYSLISEAAPLMGHYGKIRVTENYIYADYIDGPPLNEAKNAVNRPESIRVFDWELNPVAILSLDEPIVSFDIDLMNNRLIAFTEGEEYPFVYFDFDEESL